jgi:hypothetical protein
LSPRADEELFIEFCEDFDYAPVLFEAFQTVNGERKLIYHTNVMMCLGETFAVICADCIDDRKERKMVLDNLKRIIKRILITEEQLILSLETCWKCEVQMIKDICNECGSTSELKPKQVEQLEKTILSSSLDVIEACGGGSSCMMAEIFLVKDKKKDLLY